MKRFFKALFRAVLVAAFWITIWYVAAHRIGMELLLPSPGAVLVRLGEIMSTSEFYITTLSSLVRVLIGIILASLIGIALAVITHISKIANALIEPVITVIKATPVASFIILALVWLDRGRLPIFISLLMVLPIVWTNLMTGLNEVDTKLIEMARIFSVSKLGIIKNIYIPSLMPYFTSAAKTSMGLAWKAGIAAEVLAVPARSIGKKLFESKAYLETTDLFAWTAVVIILSLIIELVFELAMSRIFKRSKKAVQPRKGEKTNA